VAKNTPQNNKQTTGNKSGQQPKGGEQNEEFRKLTKEEINELAGEELPERAVMSLINANVALPVNAAIALNALSDNSIAYAEATQDVQIDQSN
jgi:hypothetical protein